MKQEQNRLNQSNIRPSLILLREFFELLEKEETMEEYDFLDKLIVLKEKSNFLRKEAIFKSNLNQWVNQISPKTS